MSIIALKKVTMIVPVKEKSAFLSSLQALGECHIISLKESNQLPINKRSDIRAESAYEALNFLNAVKYKRHQLTRSEDFDVQAITAQALTIKNSLRDKSDKLDFLNERIEQMRPWGDITFPPTQTLRGNYLWFYRLPLKHMDKLTGINLPWQIVSQSTQYAYLVIIAPQEPPPDLLPVARIHMGALPMQELCNEREQTVSEIEELEAQRQKLTRYLLLIRLHLAEADDQALLDYVSAQSLDSQHWFLLQAWVPRHCTDELTKICQRYDSALVVEEPAFNELPPTLLEQPPALATGTDMSLFYQTPAYHSWDPSKLLLASFCLFFAMILADAGYGLVLLVIMLGSKKWIRRKTKGSAYLLLGIALSFTTCIYGVLVGSYFGISPAPSHWLAHFHILHIKDFDSMMQLSIYIGALHIVIANAMHAYHLPHATQKLVPCGWILIICAGLLLWQAQSSELLVFVAIALLVAGTLLILTFSSMRQTDSFKAHIMRFMDGAIQLSGLMSLFGDILSYMRLFALGLASASLAVTFNQLASDVYSSSSGLGLLGAILILVLGHVLNLLLSLISGLVHGLRLNFIEFYKWGLPVEGQPFKRFKRKGIDNE
ncbi:hypothetical protein QTP81_04295 [Alteromonas sp. ASW11-36]|uniref:V-type ATP synthase subunit I n=1 Tax=Alteromonas arenosi TaxID=3055817 RepID=A0ABT7SUZ4_9ALTE|nr:hypothetical protein [Alteromonas sp. ASW11-36]MDM7859819.1 hypothetical protein [Alteromonas sp. ASW11-36]